MIAEYSPDKHTAITLHRKARLDKLRVARQLHRYCHLVGNKNHELHV